MKIGCSAWSFTKPHYNAPYEDAITTIGDLGFEAVELIVFSDEDLNEYYTKSRISQLRRLYESYGMQLSELAVYDGVVQGLSSLDPAKKAKALEAFEKCAGVAVDLGTDTINMVSQWPEGLKGPTSYPPHAIYLEVRGGQYFHPKNTLELPENFSWAEVWDNYVDSMTQVSRIAAEKGLRFALEGHTHVIVPNTEGMLRLFDHVGADNLGTNFDTGWHFMQREYIPMSIYKLADRIFHVHTRDGDGILSYGLPAGQGIIDWEEVIRALIAVGYDGVLSFEMTRYKDTATFAKKAQEYLRSVIQSITAE